MRQKLVSLLKKWPFLYNLAASAYANMNSHVFKENIIGTKAREQEWATRHQRKGNDWNNQELSGSQDEWVLSYWNSKSHPHRAYLIDKIAEFSPISSVLEIGCNCGPNLHLLAQKYPDIILRGIDINPTAVEKGNHLFTAEGFVNVQLSVSKAHELSQFPDKTFDVVFTDAVLIYVGRDKIQRTIQEMLRVARRGLVLVERHCFDSSKDKDGLGTRHYGLWQRDYIRLLHELIPEEQVSIIKITEHIWPDPEWQESGAIIKVSLL